MCKIYVVDAPCGSGKTTGAINMIKENPNRRYLFITPFLQEVQRIKEECSELKFYEPQEKNTKLNGIHWLLANKKNIVSTHALFLNFNDYTLELIRNGDYTLILDEVASVVELMEISKKDLNTILDKYGHIEDGLLIWDDLEYEGKFSDIMNMSLNKCIGIYGNCAVIWCFPIEIFKAFKEVYILTYMFDAQIQKYYYDFYSVNYKHLYVKKDNGIYCFTDEPQDYKNQYNYQNKIYILDSEKLNSIGDNYTALSVSWFTKDKQTRNKPLINTLKNNLYNYFRNITKSSSEYNMWTTFKEFKSLLRGDGYSRGFLAVNARATNDYRHKTNLAYCANIFMNPVLKQFFAQKNIVVNEDKYALSEMIQWIWRSAIRDNGEINVYIPSSRMRNLLIDWLNSFSK